MNAVFWITVLLIGIGLPISVFLLAPGKVGKKRAPFEGRNFAHRGLFQADQSIPENSLPAFALAAEHGYGIELDVQLSRDGQVVVFHDDALTRMCGLESRVDALDYADLEKLSLHGTDERIPLFSTVLETVGGRVPLIVELKNGPRNPELCQKTLDLLLAYDGIYCIESFNPMIVAWFRKHAPAVFRGQLAQPPAAYRPEHLSPLTSFLLGNVLLNFLARPNFIAYRIGPKPLAVRLAEELGALRVAWTSHDTEAEASFDAVIFEHYLPNTRFRPER